MSNQEKEAENELDPKSVSNELEWMLAEAKIKKDLFEVQNNPDAKKQNTIIFGFLIKIVILISALAGTLYWTIAWMYVGYAVFS